MDPLVLRFVERFLVVIFSGLAVYLGYRLFLAVPTQKNASGEIKLPWDISVVMSRIGPGAFFALFGVVVLSLSLLQPLKFDSTGSGYSNASYMGAGAAAPPAARDVTSNRADARALLRRDMATLNAIPQQLSLDLSENDRNGALRALRRVKLQLMKPIWGEPKEGFGEFAAFERWVEGGEPDPLPAGMAGALDLYKYGSR